MVAGGCCWRLGNDNEADVWFGEIMLHGTIGHTDDVCGREKLFKNARILCKYYSKESVAVVLCTTILFEIVQVRRTE